MFQNLFREYEEVELIPYDIREGQYPQDLKSLDGFISTGSSLSVYDEEEWISQFEDFLRELYKKKLKYFGVCFGYQMLARALGGKVVKARQGWMVGVKSVEVHSSQDWMSIDPRPNSEHVSASEGAIDLKVNVISSHQDQVVSLPANGVPIASSEGCPYAMFVVGDSLAGIQGHPEFQTAYAQPLLESRRGLIADDIVDAGILSFGKALDSQVVARWVIQFMKKKLLPPPS